MASGVSIPVSACSSHAISYPQLTGATFTSKEAHIVTNYSRNLENAFTLSPPKTAISGIDFCNVSLQYGHDGHDENIAVEVWLPLINWNGRMMGAGGGGWFAGLVPLTYNIMASGLDEGFAVVSTNAGHGEREEDPAVWAVKANGELNHHALEDFASTALGDSAIIAKHIIKQVSGKPPEYSYWKGCSTGGRQGLMLSQKYPEAFDGILAAAPATNWPEFLVAEYYPQLIMNQLRQYPSACELAALTTAAIAVCDSDDGVRDGVISDVDACAFDPTILVGTKAYCPATQSWVEISKAAALVSKALWSGAKAVNGKRLWSGLSQDAPATGQFNLANTECKDDGVCHGLPFRIAEQWIKTFVVQDQDFDLSKISHEHYDRIFSNSTSWYMNVIGSNDPDLGRFRSRGGKMITWHGLADQVIFPNGTKRYYEAVLEKDPAAHDFYRYFETPGVEHCLGGPGPYPYDAFQSLIDWVEKGQPPDMLTATSPPDERGLRYVRPLCPYPLVARYAGTGDPRLQENFYCADSYLSSTPIALFLDTFRHIVSEFTKKLTQPLW